MIRVLLVDDQELVRSGFRIILESEPGVEVVGEAANGADAVMLAATTSPDVICMDIEMPVMNGIEASRQIQRSKDASAAAILILTTFGHERYLFDALSAGVSGFLLKTARAEQLIDAVRTLASGNALLGPDVTRAVIERVSQDRAAAAGTPPLTASPPAGHEEADPLGDAGLTERERDVLLLLAEGLSNAEIAERLFLGEATVKTHVSNLLQKVGARDRIQAVVWAHTRGVVT
ncbi:response regulator [Leucobacter sp. GX24907]